MSGPNQADVDALRDLLDLMANFPDNDQRARYLLTCNWFRDRDAARLAAFRAEAVAAIEARMGRDAEYDDAMEDAITAVLAVRDLNTT